MTNQRPLLKRMAIWVGTAAVAWTLVLVGKHAVEAIDGPDTLDDGDAAQVLSCSADQLDDAGRCL